ncbi:MAG TPA: hemerythrin domain-containing protein, partial [Dissulfurispiraceae bacterium]
AKLIEELKKEHAAILENLDKAYKLGITRDGQSILMSAKTGLLAHLKKEDSELYPVLRKAAESDGALKQTLDTFAKDMETTSKDVLAFFGKYTQGQGAGMDFAKDFGRLFVTLKTRIQKEERILYTRYEQLGR